jgi:hypothetical protein
MDSCAGRPKPETGASIPDEDIRLLRVFPPAAYQGCQRIPDSRPKMHDATAEGARILLTFPQFGRTPIGPMGPMGLIK